MLPIDVLLDSYIAKYEQTKIKQRELLKNIKAMKKWLRKEKEFRDALVSGKTEDFGLETTSQQPTQTE